MPDTTKDVLEHIADLLSSDPFKNYFNANMPEVEDYAVINAETGEVFVISVSPGRISRA